MDKRIRIILLVIAILPGLVLRGVLAPYTTGSDIPQFAGFTDTFLRHGLCFYMYSDGSRALEEDWPYGWPYVYGPGLILLLAPLRLLAPTPVKHYWKGSTYYVYAPMDWIIASKSLFILFDTLSAIITYIIALYMTRSYKRSLLALIIYYYNPMTIYISSIYGMFDQVALAPLLLGSYLYLKYGLNNKYGYTGLFLTGLSIAIKQTMLYPLLIFIIHILAKEGGWIRRVKGLTLIVIGASILFIPFFTACPQSLQVFIKAMGSVSKPGYTYPVVYSFNGLSSLATYINGCCGKDTLFMIEYWYIPAVTLLALVLLGYLYRRDLPLYMAYAYIVYTATYWRVNHQYLVPTTASAIIILLLERRDSVRILSSILLILIALWPLMFPVSWWAHAHIEKPNKGLIEIMDMFSLMIFDDLYYLLYSLTLTTTQILLILHGVGRDAISTLNSLGRYLERIFEETGFWRRKY